jgi:hypothetical protein
LVIYNDICFLTSSRVKGLKYGKDFLAASLQGRKKKGKKEIRGSEFALS